MNKLCASIFVVALLFSQYAFASNYNANMSGIVVEVLTYTHHDTIFFKLHNQPTSHAGTCNPAYFELDLTIPSERRQLLLERLLLAYQMGKERGQVTNIGYDKEVECGSFGYIKVYRIG